LISAQVTLGASAFQVRKIRPFDEPA